MNEELAVTIVSGLPRSGTSLMMQMLARGGMEILTDDIRAADVDNPGGYHEFERVKRTKEDPSWIPGARGKAVKMVSSLLYDLTDTESYRILFMRRDMEEILESQEKMLRRLGRPAAPRDQIRASFAVHLERIFRWLPAQGHMRVLEVDYNILLRNPEPEVERIATFLEGHVPADRMLGAIRTDLYRNRR